MKRHAHFDKISPMIAAVVFEACILLHGAASAEEEDNQSITKVLVPFGMEIEKQVTSKSCFMIIKIDKKKYGNYPPPSGSGITP